MALLIPLVLFLVANLWRVARWWYFFRLPRSSVLRFPFPRIFHGFDAFVCDTHPYPQPSDTIPIAKTRASTILTEFDQAHAELVGKAVILTDGKAGTVDNIWLDALHGIRISIRGHEGKWPISTIKLAQTD